MTAVFASVEIGLTFWTLAFVLNLNRRRDDRAAQGAAQNFLKAGHFHCPRCFSRFGATRPTFRLFARLFSLLFAMFATTFLVTALAVFSFHRKGLEESFPGVSLHFTVVLLIRLQQSENEMKRRTKKLARYRVGG